jgi:hypothetical protein
LTRQEFNESDDTFVYGNSLSRLKEDDEPAADRTKYLPWKGEEIAVDQYLEGMELPRATQGDGSEWPQGAVGDYRVGTHLFYREARLGPYLVGINSTGAPERAWPEGISFEMTVPDGDVERVRSGEVVSEETVTVEPRSAVALKIR